MPTASPDDDAEYETISIALDNALIERLEDYAKKNSRTIDSIVEEVLELFISNPEMRDEVMQRIKRRRETSEG